MTSTLETLRNAFVSTFGGTSAPLDLDALREHCAELLADLPTRERREFLSRVKQLRRADDRWHLRAALYDTVARFHGEATARKRLEMLDERLK